MLRTWATLIGACAISFGSASGQAAESAPTPSGWLGVNLWQNFECVWETNDDWKTCSLTMHVDGLQEDGPAESSGIRIGDRLLAINGTNITYENWTRLMGGIRPGAPVSVDVMRDEERHFVHVTPASRPRDPDALTWVRRQTVVASRPRERAFVFTLTEPSENDGAAFALTVRDVDQDRVDVQPAAVRVVDGQLRLTLLDERAFVDLPELRVELMGDLSGVAESAAERATSALDVFDRMGERLAIPEFRVQLARLARVGLAQPELANRFARSFGGAEFEAVRRGLFVLRVVPETAAARVGLKTGDLVIRAGDSPTRTVDDLIAVVKRESRGAVRLYWLRGDREMSQVWPAR